MPALRIEALGEGRAFVGNTELCLGTRRVRAARRGEPAQDHEIRTLRAFNGGQEQTAEINIAGLAGFLLAKSAAAYSRRKPKDWYDIAFVLLNNDRGGPVAAGRAVVDPAPETLRGRSTPDRSCTVTWAHSRDR